MGLIKAAVGAAGGVLADQWKEYFYCEAMPADVLVTKAHKKVSGRSSNKHGSENIISNGSVIAVNDGQCMDRRTGKSCRCLCRTRRIHLRYVYRTISFLW